MSKKFINPYNFVSTSDTDTRHPYRGLTSMTDGEGKPLLSGEIACVLENKTPMLVGGKRTDRANGHKEVDFFCLSSDRVPLVPAATLKGVFRSVYEAVTNSCLVFHNPNNFEGRRTTESNYEVKVGIVEYLPQASYPGKIRLADRYLALPEVVTKGGFNPEEEFKTHEVWVDDFIVPGTDGSSVPIRRVRALSKARQGGCTTRGYLHITGKIPVSDLRVPAGLVSGNLRDGDPVSYRCRKVHEQFEVKEITPGCNFVFSGTLRMKRNGWCIERKKKHVVAIPREGTEVVSLSKDEYDRYLHVQRHGRRNKEECLELKPGDVVFFRKGDNGTATFLTRSSLGRESFDKSVSGLMSVSEQPCTHVNRDKRHDEWKVCPACQLFGLVEDRRSARSPESQAYAAAGRVRFTHARPLGWDENKRGEWFAEKKPLPILSGPKPSCTPFYLRGRREEKGNATLCTSRWIGSERNGKLVPDAPYYYEAGAVLRGRKFYVSQPEKRLEHCIREDGLADNQNVSARLLKPGKRFVFKVQFEGLTEEELGGLLYVLELERCLHGIGAGKPIGMGACMVSVESIKTHSERWSCSLDAAQRWEPKDTAGLVGRFKEFRSCQEGRPFEEIFAVRDLKLIRSVERQLEVMYPRKHHSFKERGTQQVGFKWFMDHATLSLTARERKSQYLPLPEHMESKPLLTALTSVEIDSLNVELSAGLTPAPARAQSQQPARGYAQHGASRGPVRPAPGPAPIGPVKRTGQTLECEALDEVTGKGKRRFRVVGGGPTDVGCLLDEGKVPDKSLIEAGCKVQLMVRSESPNNIQFDWPK